MANTTSTFNMSMKESNFFEILMKPMQDLLTKSYQTIFDSMQNIFYNNLSYTIILIIILYWLIMRLKTGYPTRDEIFEAGKWLFMVLFVFGIFSSFEAYVGFCNLIMIPANWVKGAVSSLIDTNNGNLTDNILNAIDLQNDLAKNLFQKGIEEADKNDAWYAFWNTDDLKGVFVAISLGWYWLYYIVFMICIIACVCIVIGSQFITMLLLSVAPILIPFLIIKPLKAYFFSWLKLVISYSLYPSIALILLILAMSPINDLKGTNTADAIQKMYKDTFFTFTPAAGFCIFVIYLMTKIPNWVSQIMGVSGLDSGGVGTGLAMAKNAGLAAATGGASGVMTKMAGGSFFGGAARGALGTMPGAKTLGSVKEAVSKRMKAGAGKTISNGAGATASAE